MRCCLQLLRLALLSAFEMPSWAVSCRGRRRRVAHSEAEHERRIGRIADRTRRATAALRPLQHVAIERLEGELEAASM